MSDHTDVEYLRAEVARLDWWLDHRDWCFTSDFEYESGQRVYSYHAIMPHGFALPPRATWREAIDDAMANDSSRKAGA